jgi:solute carrier family 35, member E1
MPNTQYTESIKQQKFDMNMESFNFNPKRGVSASSSTSSKVLPFFSLQKLKNSLPDINLKLISLCFIWYFTSVISSSTTKQILKEFKYPVSLTEIQFVITGVLCVLLITFIRISEHNFNFNLFNKFPNGTFPPQLANESYSILNQFLQPSYLILKTTVPMGVFQFLGQIASHNSTSIIPVSLVHTIKALSPLTTVLIYRFLFNKKFQTKTYLTLVPLITGVMLCCTRNDNLDISPDMVFRGSMFAFLSMLIFVSQNIFAKKILTWEDPQKGKDKLRNNDKRIRSEENSRSTSPSYSDLSVSDDEELDDSRATAFLNKLNWRITRPESAASTPLLPMHTPKNNSTYFFLNNAVTDSTTDLKKFPGLSSSPSAETRKLDKLSVLFYCSLVGFTLTLPFYIISEFRTYSATSTISVLTLSSCTLKHIAAYGFAHFIQSLTAFQILGMVSPVNYSIANILKRIIIISCSIIIEGITLNLQQGVGLSLTFAGLYCYDKWGVQRT